ncbi:hypothetical protein C9I47_2659 [Lysobacter maris]|uniref:DUF2339 domain-containing protein n=1 Tax=Marilutibacter maris TaxID=1605891 RepID=A0A2U9TAC8_9GAMM|nr:hypothetical protein C9I47_2659 [Lysobacter maris]
MVAAAPDPVRSPPPLPRTPPARSGPDPVTRAARVIKRWFTEGNVPVKVGMLVLFAGVAALLKYASDQGWVAVPVEFRYAGVAAAALAGLVFGWRQRERRRVFALSLQGGAIGVLLLVAFAAFKVHPLLPAGAAFALSVVLVAGAGVLAVMQRAIALAVLGILAGFLAPIWLSTGTGSHVALFAYYAVLNAAILAIAWWRPWRVLNLMGFVFTFGIGTLWGVLQYRPDHFQTTEPFLLLFFAFYLAIPILYARRRAAGGQRIVDACLVFGTPLVAFSLQAALLEGARMPLAFCALALALVYLVLAWMLRMRERYQPLVAPYAVLAVGFATLAVPLALSAQATASVFALEGAAAVWLGLRQQRRLPQIAGLLLQLAAAGSFLIGLEAGSPAQALANPRFTGGLLIAIAGFASAWSYRRSAKSGPAAPYYLWGLVWWIGTALAEIDRFAPPATDADLILVLATLTALLAGVARRWIDAAALDVTVAAALAAAVPLAFAQADAHAQPFAGLGLLAWVLYAGCGIYTLSGLRRVDGRARGFAHAGWVAAWTVALGLGLLELAKRLGLGDGWWVALAAAPLLAVAAATLWRPGWIGWPLATAFQAWRPALRNGLLLVLALAFVNALTWSGDAAPLPWIALLNPLDLFQAGALLVLANGLRSMPQRSRLRAQHPMLLAVAGFALISVITLRATHHWGGVDWRPSMLQTSLVQTALTVVWSMLGVVGWVVGSRRGRRTLWLAGAVLMAVVLAKLVLVDRQHLGNLLGIASFIAYGLLCTAVGYFAPAPPKTSAPRDSSGETA